MVAAGEDPKFIARRLIISASEDVGSADPRGCRWPWPRLSARLGGLPEAQYALAQATLYLATRRSPTARDRPTGKLSLTSNSMARWWCPSTCRTRRIGACATTASASAIHCHTTTRVATWTSSTCPVSSRTVATTPTDEGWRRIRARMDKLVEGRENGARRRRRSVIRRLIAGRSMVLALSGPSGPSARAGGAARVGAPMAATPSSAGTRPASGSPSSPRRRPAATWARRRRGSPGLSPRSRP